MSSENSSMFKNFITEKPLVNVMTFGILVGWALCFVLICFIIGGKIEDILNMEEEVFRMILFISFPMGAILGVTFVLIARKEAREAEKNIEAKPKNTEELKQNDAENATNAKSASARYAERN